MGLGPGTRKTLEALREVTADGWPATVREVAAAAGFSSQSTAFYHLLSLERLGLAVRHPRRPETGGWRPSSTGVGS